MKILLVHNRYRERGGEDSVFEQEADLLHDRGIEVATYAADNAGIGGLSSQVATFRGAKSNPVEIAKVMEQVDRFEPDLVHIHNFFPLLSPRLHVALAGRGLPLVQTLHNYRLLCANGMFLRDGEICELCLGPSRMPALRHRCYRGSLPATLAVLRMQDAAIRSPEWRSSVTRFIALTKFAQDKFVTAGLPSNRTVVKPNSCADPGPAGASTQRRGALFVGRLAPEKGVAQLLQAWRQDAEGPLTIIGDGPERTSLESSAPQEVSFTGALPREQVVQRMKSARLLVVPSTWYEGFPMVVAEAFACGLPVIAPRLGGFPEIVRHGENGFLFQSGDAEDLMRIVREALCDTVDLPALSAQARRDYETAYSPEANFRQLMAIYSQAIEEKAAK
jgi:glycosyltransferase involved in cell wall biosynthesis